MGNLLKSCGNHVVPVEEGRAGDHSPDQHGGQGSGAGAGSAAESPEKAEGTQESPTTITGILSNALYAMAFHKHLALT